MNDPSLEVPLVTETHKGFTLSPQFLQAVGPFWGQSWSVQAFVCHVISHFDNSLEHLLDSFPEEDDQTIFDVSLPICQRIAEKYRDEFFPLSPNWYQDLYRAKLRSLRIPIGLIVEVKYRYLERRWDYRRLATAYRDLLRGTVSDQKVVEHLQQVEFLDPHKGWMLLESTVEELLHEGILEDTDIHELLEAHTR